MSYIPESHAKKTTNYFVKTIIIKKKKKIFPMTHRNSVFQKACAVYSCENFNVRDLWAGYCSEDVTVCEEIQYELFQTTQQGLSVTLYSRLALYSKVARFHRGVI